MASEAVAVAPPLITLTLTGCPQAPEPLRVMNSMPWARWPAERAVWVQVAPPLVCSQLQPPINDRAVPSAEPLPCPSPPKPPPIIELPAGSAITTVSGPDATESVLVTWYTTASNPPRPATLRLAVSRTGAAAGAGAGAAGSDEMAGLGDGLDGDGDGDGDGDATARAA